MTEMSLTSRGDCRTVLLSATGPTSKRVDTMTKIILGKNQMETLEEMMNVAINFLQGIEEYQADQKRYEKVREAIENQKIKQAQA